MLRQNLAYRIAAILVAVFLWFYVMITSENPVVEVGIEGVQLEARGAAPGLSVELVPGEVTAAVTGPRKVVTRLSGDDITAWVTLGKPGPGRWRLRPHVRVKGEFSARIKPSTVVAVVREASKKTLPVEIELLDLPEGYIPGVLSSKPAQAAVEGKEETVTRVVRVIARVNVQRRRNFSGEVEPVAVDAKGRSVGGVALRPRKVWVEAVVTRTLSARVVPVVVRTSGSLAPGFRISSVTATPAVATVTGEDLDETQYVETSALRLQGRRTSLKATLPLVRPPQASSVVPDKVEVSLAVEPR